jgi:hypothetical protein
MKGTMTGKVPESGSNEIGVKVYSATHMQRRKPSNPTWTMSLKEILTKKNVEFYAG